MKTKLIIITGLDDGVGRLQFITRNWKTKYGIEVFVQRMDWKGKDQDFEKKLKRIINKIDEFSSRGYKISLLGTSAGGSVAINAYILRKNKINKVINVGGRLREGVGTIPSLEQATRNSISFKESVLRCERNLKLLTKTDKQKILTIRPLYDEVAPISLMTIKGATNIQILSLEHTFSIFLALTVYKRTIVNFLMLLIGNQAK